MTNLLVFLVGVCAVAVVPIFGFVEENYADAISKTAKDVNDATSRHYGSYPDYTGDCCQYMSYYCSYTKYPVYNYAYSSYYNNYGCDGYYSTRGYFYYNSYTYVCNCRYQNMQCTPPTTAAPTPPPPPPPTTAAPTTTTAAPTTTTAAPTTTTAAPTTTTAAPTTTTTVAPTTTTTAAPTTTTTATPRFCPATSTVGTGISRVLGGTPITSCTEYPGVVSLQTNGLTLVTGVMTSPTTLSIPANLAPAFVGGLSVDVVAQDGTVIATNIPGPTGTVTNGGPVEITLPTVPTAGCPGVACIYTDAMANFLNRDSCRVVGTGYDTNTGTTGSGFQYVNITTFLPYTFCENLISGTNQADLFDFTKPGLVYNCFGAQGSTCTGDTGGPVVCDLTTGEQVVIGQTENAPCQTNGVVGFYNIQAAAARFLLAQGDLKLRK